MGHPERDPHGELIPTAELDMPLDTSIPLSTLRPKRTAALKCVKAADKELLRYLEELGLIPGAKIEVTHYSPFDHNTTIRTRHKLLVLGLGITSKIFVEEI